MLIVKNYLDSLKLSNIVVEFNLIQDDYDLMVEWTLNGDLTLKHAIKVNKDFFKFLREVGIEFSVYHEDCGIDNFEMVLRDLCNY